MSDLDVSWTPFDIGDPHILASGEATLPRHLAASAAAGTTSGSLRLSYFTARKTESVGSLRFASGTTGAGATPTLVRLGVYEAAPNGDISLVASIPNDTTLLAAANTGYTRALSAAFTKVEGRRYAVGTLVVTGAAAPTLVGMSLVTLADINVAPRISGVVTGQTDLPATVVNASIAISAGAHYVALLPA